MVVVRYTCPYCGHEISSPNNSGRSFCKFCIDYVPTVETTIDYDPTEIEHVRYK